MKKPSFKLTISRPTSSSGDSYIAVEVKDDVSGKVLLRGRVDLADFAAALTGLAYQPMEVEHLVSESGFGLIGMRRSVYGYQLPVDHDAMGYSKAGREAYLREQAAANPELTKMLAQGWAICDWGLNTQQNYRGTWTINLERYDAPEEAKR